MKKVLMSGVALGFGLALTATAALADIQIGVAGPMTGQYAAFGEQLKRGAEMAVADINAAGGVNGEKLVLNIGDDACDPKQAVAVANDMASKKIVFMAGHFCSGSSIPASEVYAEENIVQISPASTNPKFTDERPGKGVFRVVGRDDAQGIVAGNFLAKNFAGKNIAILDDKSPYGKGLADETRKALNAAGGKEVINEVLHGRREGLHRARLQAQGSQGRCGLCRRLSHRRRPHPAPDARPGSERADGLGRRLQHGRVLDHHRTGRRRHDLHLRSRSAQQPDAADVVKKFKDGGYDPEGYTLYTYAAIKVWADAVKAAGGTEFDKVVDALMKTDTDSVVGKLRFDDKGDIKDATYVWYKWSNGNYAEDKSM